MLFLSLNGLAAILAAADGILEGSCSRGGVRHPLSAQWPSWCWGRMLGVTTTRVVLGKLVAS